MVRTFGRRSGGASGEVLAEGTVTLSGGTGGPISTGASGGEIDVQLDPSNDGQNGQVIDLTYSVQWNNSSGEHEVFIEEDDTSVGNPTVGYRIVGYGVSDLNPTPSTGPTVTTVDDFNDGTADGYSGADGFQVTTTNALEGTHSLTCTDEFGRFSADSHTTTRDGREYLVRVNAQDEGERPGFLVNAQASGSAALNDCYWANFRPDWDQCNLVLRENNSNSATLSSASVSQGLEYGTEYQVGVVLNADSVSVNVYDADGNQIGDGQVASDTTHTGGTYAFYQGTDGTQVGSLWDDVRYRV